MFYVTKYLENDEHFSFARMRIESECDGRQEDKRKERDREREGE